MIVHSVGQALACGGLQSARNVTQACRAKTVRGLSRNPGRMLSIANKSAIDNRAQVGNRVGNLRHNGTLKPVPHRMELLR